MKKSTYDLYNEVKTHLEFSEHCRKSDETLVVNIWTNALSRKNLTWFDLPRELHNKRLPNYESICRFARKIRKENGWVKDRSCPMEEVKEELKQL